MSEIAQCLAVGVAFSRIEDLDGHRRATGGPTMTAATGDRQLPHKVLEFSLTEDVIPKSYVFNQFTSPVTKPCDQDRLPSRTKDIQHLGLRFDLAPPSRWQANLRRVTQVRSLLGVVDPERKLQPRLAAAFINPIEILGCLRRSTISAATGTFRPTHSPTSMGISVNGRNSGGRFGLVEVLKSRLSTQSSEQDPRAEHATTKPGHGSSFGA